LFEVWQECARIFDEKMQVIRLALKENLQKIADKYTALKKRRKDMVVEENLEKIEKIKQETEFITSVEEQPKRSVDGNDFLSITNPNLQIFDEENKEEKEKESKAHHDSLSTSMCPKPPTPPQFPSTLPALARR
jgi:hypothetical protein